VHQTEADGGYHDFKEFIVIAFYLWLVVRLGTKGADTVTLLQFPGAKNVGTG